MKSQYLLALFLGLITTFSSVKVKLSQSCDPIGLIDVMTTYSPGTKINNVLALDIGANAGKTFICSALDKRIYEYNVESKFFLTVANINIPCKSVTVDVQGSPWFLSESGIVYRLNSKTNAWDKASNLSSSIVDLTCSKYGDCFFSDKDSKIYRIDINDSKAKEMDNGIKFIDSSTKQLCGTSKNSEVLCRNASLNIGDWVNLNGAAIDIAICKNDQLFIVGTDYNVWKRDSTTWTSLTTTKNAIKLACDSKLLYLADGVIISIQLAN